jgi:glutathione synthase/RimK-type ligase-like ATP-grasp enzyme
LAVILKALRIGKFQGKNNMDTDVHKLAAADDRLIGVVSLMRQAVSGVDLGPLGTQLILRAGEDPRTANANALMDLSTVLQLRGERELALEMQSHALAMQQIYSPPMCRGQVDRDTAAVRLLAVMGAGDLMSNSPIEFLLEEADVALDLVYVTEALDLPQNLPPHDVLFVAVAESTRNIPLLDRIRTAVASWPHPVLNRPERIATLSRDNNGVLLMDVPGVLMPATIKVDRQVLDRIGQGALPIAAILDNCDFPVIVRPVDSHAGQGLERIADTGELIGYLRQRQEEVFFVSQFIDYRRADGMYCKYRIVLIDGRPFACHMGISEHWMIHYMNAGMDKDAAKREEEAAFMRDFDIDFAVRHAAAFKGINERVGLDYLGIDCAETDDGRLLIFEVDSCMIVHAIDPVDIFPYKQPQMQKVFDAFRQMLIRSATRAKD